MRPEATNFLIATARRGRVAVALNRGRNLTPKVLESLLQLGDVGWSVDLWTNELPSGYD